MNQGKLEVIKQEMGRVNIDILGISEQVMTNLDSILKSRDITLPTKVCLVKAMVFSSGHLWM